jgi:cell wall-associated NlpC family hydrolase
MLLPRDAGQQFRTGIAVPEPAPGDLLFFSAPGSRSGSITHVGISLGGGRFLEASGCVRAASLDPADENFSSTRARTYAGARRIIGKGAKSGVALLRDIPYYRGSAT